MRGGAYNRMERWLHWLALQPTAVRELAFDLERRFSLPEDSPRALAAEAPVYVCGLARSGTTVLLRALARAGVFRSLTYRDMPFVLAPNLWGRLRGGATRSLPPSERAHGDGIMVDFDSPEAFEEVFWRTFCPQPDDPRKYGSVQPSAETMASFAQFRAAVVCAGAGSGAPKRYLSKNNNNLVRLDALAADPTATILVAYRDPVDVARSLHRQHARFSQRQSQEPFTRDYMRWLGHHEFGLDHKPFSFALPRMKPGLSANHPDYWLDYWTAIHSHLAVSLPERARFVDHDKLCAEPSRVLQGVLGAVGVRADASELATEIRAVPAPQSPPVEFAADLLGHAYAAYELLRASPRNSP